MKDKMRIILDKASTESENELNDGRSRPAVLEAKLDSDREDGATIKLALTAEIERAEFAHGNVTVTTWVTPSELSAVLSKLVKFATLMVSREQEES